MVSESGFDFDNRLTLLSMFVRLCLALASFPLKLGKSEVERLSSDVNCRSFSAPKASVKMSPV